MARDWGEISSRVAEVLVLKQVERRFRVSLFIMDQMLKEGPSLIGEDKSLKESNWNLCVESVFELWEASACLWNNGKFATATALAISALEETGKLAAERMRVAGARSIKFSDDDVRALEEEWNLRRKPFLDHFTKSVLAVMSGALINARLDRVVGIDFVIDFLRMAEEGKLEAIRQQCLYLDVKENLLQRPQDAVSAEVASRYVALAGEVLAEILFDPKDWESRLKIVADFELGAGLTRQEPSQT